MNKKYIVIATIAGVLLTAGVVTGISVNNFIDSTFTDPMDEAIFFKYVSTGQLGEAMKFMDMVKQQELDRQAADNLSPEEKEAGYQKMMADAAESARKNALNPPAQPVFPNGMYEVNSIIPHFNEKHIFIFNAWKHDLLGAEAGYYTYNPSRGLLIVADGSSDSKFYLTPTAAGPVKITAEKDGVLTLVSVGGTYEVQDPEKDADHYDKVTVEGGVIYHFDLKTRTFK